MKQKVDLFFSHTLGRDLLEFQVVRKINLNPTKHFFVGINNLGYALLKIENRAKIRLREVVFFTHYVELGNALSFPRETL